MTREMPMNRESHHNESSLGETCDLMIRNAHVLTCDAERSVFPTGAVAVGGAQIAGVGTEFELDEPFTAARTIDVRGL